MARVFFNNAGSVNPVTDASNRVQFPSSTNDNRGFLLLTNDADSSVVGRVNAEIGISLNGDDAGEDMDFKLQAKSYMLIPYLQVGGSSESARRVDISTSHTFTSHRTSANSGEHVYIAIVQ